MIEIQLVNRSPEGANQPHLFCDHCQTRIHRAGEGIALFPATADGYRAASRAPIRFVHKGVCDVRDPDPAKHLSSMDLDIFLVFLSRNLDVEWGGGEALDRAAAARDF